MAIRRRVFDLTLDRDEYVALMDLQRNPEGDYLSEVVVEAATSMDRGDGPVRVRVALAVDDAVADPRGDLQQRLLELMEDDDDRERSTM